MNKITNYSREGNLNPMHGKRHNTATKKKISDSQKARYAAIKRALQERAIFELAEDDIHARKEVIHQLIANNRLNFESVQQAINFLAIVIGKDNIVKALQEEIDKAIRTLDTNK